MIQIGEELSVWIYRLRPLLACILLVAFFLENGKPQCWSSLKKREIIEGQFGPTQRESNTMHTGSTNRSTDTAVSNRCKTLYRGLSVTATTSYAGCVHQACHRGLEPCHLHWSWQSKCSTPCRVGHRLVKNTWSGCQVGWWDMAPNSCWTAAWEYREQAQMSPLRRGRGNFLALVCKFTVWTVSKKSQDVRFRQMRFNVFSEYSSSSTPGF